MPFNIGDVKLRTDLRDLVIGQENRLYLIVENSQDNPQSAVTATLEVENGLIIRKTFGDNWVHGEFCTYKCDAKFQLGPGATNPETYLILSPRQEGKFEVKVDTQWEVVGNSTPKINSTSTNFDVADKIVDKSVVHLYANRTEMAVGENSIINLDVVNAGINQNKMIADVILAMPDGLSISGTGFADSCTSICTAHYEINPGEPEYLILTVIPNEVGEFTIKSKMDWRFEGDPTPYGGEDTVILTVRPRNSSASEREPTATPTPAPTPTLTHTPTPTVTPTPLPPPPPVASGNSNGQGNLFWYIVVPAIAIVVVLLAWWALAFRSNRKRKQNSGSAPNQPPNQPPNSGQNPP